MKLNMEVFSIISYKLGNLNSIHLGIINEDVLII